MKKSSRLQKKTETADTIAPAKKVDLKSVVFKSIKDTVNFSPVPKTPTPAPLRLRHQAQWWVRCTSNDIIPYQVCHESFVDINALYRKGHPCWNCPLGKVYRRVTADDNFEQERVDTLVQLDEA